MSDRIKGELYYTLHSLEMGAWTAFVIYCFWHGHNLTAWILVALLVLDSVGVDAKMKRWNAEGWR